MGRRRMVMVPRDKEVGCAGGDIDDDDDDE